MYYKVYYTHNLRSVGGNFTSRGEGEFASGRRPASQWSMKRKAEGAAHPEGSMEVEGGGENGEGSGSKARGSACGEAKYFHDFISPRFLDFLLQAAQPTAVERLSQVGSSGTLDTPASMDFLCTLYDGVRKEHAKIMTQRKKDRNFIDRRVHALSLMRGDDNISHSSIIGLRDADDRVVMGPTQEAFDQAQGEKVASLPPSLVCPHVTAFGTADEEEACEKALTAYRQKLPNEPAEVQSLLSSQACPPMWGVDLEDSLTPTRELLAKSGANLRSCLSRRAADGSGGGSFLSKPIVRLPGLGLPSHFLFCDSMPVPLHLYTFAVHLWEHWEDPEALVFYIPKLESEEEAAYLKRMIGSAEHLIRAAHPGYVLGSVRILVVIENPRALFRLNEIADALHPYFAGSSLGWHDYLASSARLFKEAPAYHIPPKADPQIVIKHMKGAHELIARVVGERQGVCVGGMYGVVPVNTDPQSASYQVCLRGFIKDVITQLRRGLQGFWVAHTEFVRIGLAVMEGWKVREATGDAAPLEGIVRGLLQPDYCEEVLQFAAGADISTKPMSDDRLAYLRSLTLDDVAGAASNNDESLVRFNVFQSLQYLAEWLRGNGNVFLPSTVDGVPVLVADDLATVERSRWEVWHEIRHGRLPLCSLLRIAHEELKFIQKDRKAGTKFVQIKWGEETAKWYPLAMRLMIKLMTDPSPVEFAPQLLWPFTNPFVRAQADPTAAIRQIDPNLCALEPFAERFCFFFERCGCESFAKEMASQVATDLVAMEAIIRAFDQDQIIEAASFHGDIGEGKKTLDKMAEGEQAKVLEGDEAVAAELRAQGAVYLERFGVKFLVSAKGKSGGELLDLLKQRMGNNLEEELANAREALWQITLKRVSEEPLDTLVSDIEALRLKHGVVGASFCVSGGGTRGCQPLCFGESVRGAQPVTDKCLFEIASLSKTIGTAVAMEYFRERGIPLTKAVNDLLQECGSTFRLAHPVWAQDVQLRHLMSHSALNMHYVKGIPLGQDMPDVRDLLEGNEKYSYPPIEICGAPGSFFQYSGGGFMVLQHLIESFEKKPIDAVVRPFLDALGIQEGSLTFDNHPSGCSVAHGYHDDGEEVEGSRLMFPAFAAGALGTPYALMHFLQCLSEARKDVRGCGPISHDTAIHMLHGTDKGCQEFMGCKMGMGVFVAEAGENRFAIHQGANDGFRGLYLYCFKGPDEGKGMSLHASGDNRAMFFIAEATQLLLSELSMQGVDTSKFQRQCTLDSIPQEEAVNYGYKSMVFNAFARDFAEEIAPGPPDSLAPFNLAVGASVLSVSNESFARASNLLSPYLPVFDPELFGRQGKIMDSWETARHNQEDYEELKIALKRPGQIRYIAISTKYHLGNQGKYVEISGCNSSGATVLLVPKLKLEGHAEKRVLVPQSAAGETIEKVTILMYPDGGLTRLGLYGEDLPQAEGASFSPIEQVKSVKYADPIPSSLKPLSLEYEASADQVKKMMDELMPGEEFDVACKSFGGTVISATDEHYAPASQVISPYIPLDMFDGFESARSHNRDHHEEIVIGLGTRSVIHRIEMEFTYFVNNNPLAVEVQGLVGLNQAWTPLVTKSEVKPFAANVRSFDVFCESPVDQLKVLVYPDGGINRVRAFARK